MVFTKNARIKQQQLGFSVLSLQILENFAREKHVKKNTTKLFFGRKEAKLAEQEFKRCIQALSKVMGNTMIEVNGCVSAVYKGKEVKNYAIK